MLKMNDDFILRGSGPYSARSAIDNPIVLKNYHIVHPGVCEWYEETIKPDDWPFWYVTNN